MPHKFLTMHRNNWTLSEIKDIYDTPLLDLIYRAATVHRQYNETGEVQVCTLLSIKTGGCPEDCAYCPQAARYNTGVTVQALLKKEEVLEYASKAKAAGSTRFCRTPLAGCKSSMVPLRRGSMWYQCRAHWWSILRI